MTQKYIIPAVSLVLLAAAALLFLFSIPAAHFSSAAYVAQMNGPMDIASTTASTTSSLVLATSTGRQYVQIGNDGPVDVYLAVGRAAVKGKGIYLKAGSTYTVDEKNLFTGAIYAIATSSQSNLSVIYKDGFQ